MVDQKAKNWESFGKFKRKIMKVFLQNLLSDLCPFLNFYRT